MFWEIGKYINSAILGMERAEYGKRIVKTLCSQLQQKCGNEYYERNIRWMMQFAEQFPDIEIVSTLGTQLNWLNRYDRQEGEEAPIGLILCTDANRKVAELKANRLFFGGKQ